MADIAPCLCVKSKFKAPTALLFGLWSDGLWHHVTSWVEDDVSERQKLQGQRHHTRGIENWGKKKHGPVHGHTKWEVKSEK